ncbi:MAG: hypothetical protein Q4G00_15415, partial [Clostridia bacterium]|nr:hypothetical protein [Clostridia bacterium]
GLIFSIFIVPESLLYFIPSAARGTSWAIPTNYLREEWVQGGHRPGAEFEAAQASTFPLLGFSLYFVLENNTVKTIKREQCYSCVCAA